METWVREYQRLVIGTRHVSIVGSLIVLVLIIREIAAVFVAVSVYEMPELPSELWWSTFRDVMIAVSIGTALLLRLVFLTLGKRDFWRASFSWVIVTLLFVAYGLFSTPSASDHYSCNSEGHCFGMYVLERQDWVDFAALLFLPGSLMRALITSMAAFTNIRSKLK